MLLEVDGQMFNAESVTVSPAPYSQSLLSQVFSARTMLQSKTGESVMIQDSPDAIKNMKSALASMARAWRVTHSARAE